MKNVDFVKLWETFGKFVGHLKDIGVALALKVSGP